MSDASETIETLLAEARSRLEALGQSLPTQVDPASISFSAKIPFKALCYREGLIWRAEELGRTACETYALGDIVAGILLTRALTETAAALWYLKELIEDQLADGPKPDLNEKVEALLLGHKIASDMPQAINVLTFLDRIDKTIPGVRQSYDRMSEYAHPNWAGTAFAYSKNDRELILTNFGRGVRGSDLHSLLGLDCLLGSLRIFEYAYNHIADIMPKFIEVCEADLSTPQQQ